MVWCSNASRHGLLLAFALLVLASAAVPAHGAPPPRGMRILSARDNTKTITADGRWLAYNSARGLVIYDLERSTVGRVVKGQMETWASWSPDGDHLAVRGLLDSEFLSDLSVIDRRTGGVTTVTKRAGASAWGVDGALWQIQPAFVESLSTGQRFAIPETPGLVPFTMDGFVFGPSGGATHAHLERVATNRGDGVIRASFVVDLTTGAIREWFDDTNGTVRGHRSEPGPGDSTVCIYAPSGLHCTDAVSGQDFEVRTPRSIDPGGGRWKIDGSYAAYRDDDGGGMWTVYDRRTDRTIALPKQLARTVMAGFFEAGAAVVERLGWERYRVYRYNLSDGTRTALFEDANQPSTVFALRGRTDRFLVTRSTDDGKRFGLALFDVDTSERKAGKRAVQPKPRTPSSGTRATSAKSTPTK